MTSHSIPLRIGTSGTVAGAGDPRRRRGQVTVGRAAVVLFGLLLGGLVACGGDDDASGPPAEVTSTVNAFTDAINTYDAEALLSVTTEDFTWNSSGEVQSRAEFVEYLETYYEAGNFNIEPTGELTVEADGDAYVAEQGGRVTSADYNDDGLSTLRLVEVDDSWLVQAMRWSEVDGNE